MAEIKYKIDYELDKENPVGRYIIDSRDNVYLNYFEYLVMSLAVWNAIWTPLTIAFQIAKDMGAEPAFVAIDAFVDFVFWIDILLQFISSYSEKSTGREIFKPKLVAKHYVC